MSDRQLPDVADFMGPSGNVTDKYGSRNPLTQTLLARFLAEIDGLIQLASPTSILDVGCGEGIVTERLANRTGATTVAEWISETRRSRTSGSFAKVASCRFAPPRRTSFPSPMRPSTAFALEVLEHLERPRDALREMTRVARRTLLVSVPREPIWRAAHFVARRDVRRLGNTPGHINHWSSRAFEQLVSEFGRVSNVRRPFPWTVVLVEPYGARRHRAAGGLRRRRMKVLSIVFVPALRRRPDCAVHGIDLPPRRRPGTRGSSAPAREPRMESPACREWRPLPPYRYSPRRSWTPWGYSESLEAGVKIRRRLYALAPLVLLSALRSSRSLVAREHFDLVNAHWVVPNGPIGALIARRHNLPLVISLQRSDISVAQQSGWIGRLARSSLPRRRRHGAERGSPRARQAAWAKGHLELIPYGADADAFVADSALALRIRERLGLDSGHTVVCGVGRFVHWKGFEYLIEAFAKASVVFPDVRLVFVGDGDLRKDLEARARSLGVSQTVTFAGMASRNEMPGYLAAADIVVVPSIHYEGYVDGLPNVALEAMAAGKPLVATRVGGLPQLVQSGENGLLIDERDSDALTAAIVTLARDPDLRSRMGESGRLLIRDSMNWDTVAARFESVYERVVERQAPQV